MMRMTCDTNYILIPDDKTCPKLAELEKVLEQCRENDAKVIVFSEWERMLELVRELCGRLDLVSEKTIEQRMLETLAQKQALSDGVLDLKGDLKEIKLRTGRQAFLAKLEQLMTGNSGASPSPADALSAKLKSPLPADRPLGFARKARELIDGALLSCEERYPSAGPHSVLYVVVERDAPQWRERLNTLHGDFFGPGRSDPLAPVRLEVVDRATHEALERLAAAGLLALTTRGCRPLFPEPEAGTTSPTLSAEERAKADAHRSHAARKLKMARLLGDGGLTEEAHGPLLDAALALARALAVEARFPEPGSLDDALLPPLSHCWKEALPALRNFAADPAQPWQAVIGALEKA